MTQLSPPLPLSSNSPSIPSSNQLNEVLSTHSQVIDPIVPQQEFGFNKDKYASNSAELMSDSSDSLSDNDSPLMT